MTDPKASSWIDRGGPPDATLARVLAFYFHRDLRSDAALLETWATKVLGMVAGDATEVNKVRPGPGRAPSAGGLRGG